MTRVVIIGGSGHVGTYLVPRLVEAGFDVVNVARGATASRISRMAPGNRSRRSSSTVTPRRRPAGSARRSCDLKPDIVIDMICFKLDSARHLVEALRGRVEHFLHCGTIWVHGPSVTVPTTEMQPRRPFGEYGIQKAAIEAFLIGEARAGGFPATIVHPGHIVGPGWAPLNPAGHFNPRVFGLLAAGEELRLPNFGLETVHHVHADDVAQVFMKAIANWSAAVGEAFHAVSPGAVSLRGYAETVAGWFGREARLKFLPYDEWKTHEIPEDAAATWEHIARSPSSSIAKAERRLDYRPRYTSFEAVYESLAWLIREGIVKTA